MAWPATTVVGVTVRSEERRVGKERGAVRWAQLSAGLVSVSRLVALTHAKLVIDPAGAVDDTVEVMTTVAVPPGSSGPTVQVMSPAAWVMWGGVVAGVLACAVSVLRAVVTDDGPVLVTVMV